VRVAAHTPAPISSRVISGYGYGSQLRICSKGQVEERLEYHAEPESPAPPETAAACPAVRLALAPASYSAQPPAGQGLYLICRELDRPLWRYDLSKSL